MANSSGCWNARTLHLWGIVLDLILDVVAQALHLHTVPIAYFSTLCLAICSGGCPSIPTTVTVLIDEDDSIVNKIVLLNEIVHLGPPVWCCRGPLYKVVWQPVFTSDLTAISTTTSTGPQSPHEVATTRVGQAECSRRNGRCASGGVQDARVGQMVPLVQSGRGPRSQILHRTYAPGCLKV